MPWVNFYTILDLSQPSSSSPPPSPQTLKDAYRRALLTHHPDKLTSAIKDARNHSVDEVTLAYRTLSNPLLRTAHDREIILQQQRASSDQHGQDNVFHTGLETIDLDDLEYDEDAQQWFRSCRCGQDRAYVLEEAQLESAAEEGQGEVLVGCRGCSLWIKVLFAVEDESHQVAKPDKSQADFTRKDHHHLDQQDAG